jgi:hypothetical protein
MPKKILIRFTREGRDAFEEVYRATIDEWTKMTGLTEEETTLSVDCDKLVDESMMDTIMSRKTVDVRLSELENIPFVVNMF